MRKITAVALEITTACNLKCPECCCMIGHRPVVHHPWSYFLSLAPWIYGIDRVDITGGEPTCHPYFSAWSTVFKDLFGCKQLTLETNGFKCRECPLALKKYDAIRLSRYPENEAEVNWVLDNFPCGGRTYVQNGSTCIEVGAEPDERKHVLKSRRGAGAPCLLGKFEFVLYADGKFWPCRLGPAIPGAVGLAPCKDWKEKVLELPIPCKDCFFSTSEEL